MGAAIKHTNYDVINVPAPNGEWNQDDWIIRPIDGFGDQNLIRMLLATERPDALFLFTDPRFFGHIFNAEDEIHQVCPIVYWKVWDNDPFPFYNEHVFEAVDLFNCHSYKTYEMLKEHYPDKTNFIPHAIPTNIFFPMAEEKIEECKVGLLGEERKDHFIAFWANRNARRKMPGDVLASWKLFIDKLEKEEGHKKATLVMHTDPVDPEGPNLYEISNYFKLKDNVVFSTERVDFGKMNILHNIADAYFTISSNEGFGLGTLEAMMCAKPIIALKTGGLTRQVVDHRDGSENGIALEPEVRNLVGSQHVPYIYEDHISNETVANALWKMYKWGPEKRESVGKKALEYARSEFSLAETAKKWDETLWDTMKNWRYKRQRWTQMTL